MPDCPDKCIIKKSKIPFTSLHLRYSLTTPTHTVSPKFSYTIAKMNERLRCSLYKSSGIPLSVVQTIPVTAAQHESPSCSHLCLYLFIYILICTKPMSKDTDYRSEGCVFATFTNCCVHFFIFTIQIPLKNGGRSVILRIASASVHILSVSLIISFYLNESLYTLALIAIFLLFLNSLKSLLCNPNARRQNFLPISFIFQVL